MNNLLQIICGDALTELKKLPDESVQMCCTSPPYWWLRDYGIAGQLGLEKSSEEYAARMVEVFREVKRVLRDDGTLWLNLGDSYTGGNPGRNPGRPKQQTNRGSNGEQRRTKTGPGLKPKDLIGIPWRVAFALQADGWWLRRDIIWHKPNAMPESVTDRPAVAHEYMFLLAKSENYYFDNEAIKEPASDAMLLEMEQGYDGLGLKDYGAAAVQNPSSVKTRIIANARKRADQFGGNKHNGETSKHSDGSVYTGRITVNKRTVWTVPTAPFNGEHFATFPPNLIKPCILAGCPVGGIVLDPFAGSFTTCMVALELGRKAIGIELNPEYVKIGRQRCNVTPGLLLSA